MTNNTTNETKNKEFTETKIEIRLRTGAAHSNKFQEAHTQIDYTSYYLGSIFWFIRVAIEAESLLDLQTKTKAYNDAQFREHIQFLVQIGEGLCEWLPNYSSELRQAGKETAAAGLSDLSAESLREAQTDTEKYTGNANLDNLALLLSGVLNSPNLPTGVYNGLVQGLDDAFNDLPPGSNKELSEYQNTPEYLAKLFQFSQKAAMSDEQ